MSDQQPVWVLATLEYHGLMRMPAVQEEIDLRGTCVDQDASGAEEILQYIGLAAWPSAADDPEAP